MQKLLSFALCSFALVCLIACTADQLPSSICYESEIQPLLNSKCAQAGCHNSVDLEEGLDYTSYEGVMASVVKKKPNKSELIEYIKTTGSSRMPPEPLDPLTVDQITLLETWILHGAQNTTGCVDTTNCGNIANPSYATDINPIMQTYCVGCHSASSPGGGYDLSTWGSTQPSLGRLVGSVKFDAGFSPMPQGGGMMPDCDIQKIEAWVNNGAPNN